MEMAPAHYASGPFLFMFQRVDNGLREDGWITIPPRSLGKLALQHCAAARR